MKYIIAYSRNQCKHLISRLNKRLNAEFTGINNPADLNIDFLKRISPRIIFFPHWSIRICSEIYENYECIIFHMTDLPYGRGGSPLQNLIVRGKEKTVISAIRCVERMDAGPVYTKKPLSLMGSATEIFLRMDRVIEDMIVEILETNPDPAPQKGETVVFNRRKPEDGNWRDAKTLNEVYDYIRMLDAEGYPPAYVYIGEYKLEFSGANKEGNSILAKVKITQEKNNE